MRRQALLIVLAAILGLGAGLAGVRAGGSAHHLSKFDVARAELVSSLKPASAISLPPLPPDCIPATGGSQPQLGAYVTFTGNVTLNNAYGQIANGTITGTVCGVATVINRPPGQCTSPPGQLASVQLYVPADGENISLPNGINLTLVPGLTINIPGKQITVLKTPIVAVVCGIAAPGPIKQTVTASLPAQANAFGATCTLTTTVPLTASVYGPLGNFHISGSNGPFVIPPLQPSSGCPSSLTNAADKLLQLPLAQPAGEITVSGSGLAYQP
jgi:hypothetical protein